jgi:hypothetical protein
MFLFTAGVYEENVDVKFVFAKSRVAQIKSYPSHVLELQAAVLATRIAASVKKELRLPYQREKRPCEPSARECKIQRARPAPHMSAPLPRPRIETFRPAFASV